MARHQPIRESTGRWWMDRHGTVWISVRSIRRKPLTDVELEAIQRAVAEFAARGCQDRVH